MASSTNVKPDASGEALAGVVERVTHHNAENGFCVLRARARGHRDLVTVVGHAATIATGEWIRATGEWVNDRSHGQQFKARFLQTSAPTSADGIEKYLSSGMIRRSGVASMTSKNFSPKAQSGMGSSSRNSALTAVKVSWPLTGALRAIKLPHLTVNGALADSPFYERARSAFQFTHQRPNAIRLVSFRRTKCHRDQMRPYTWSRM
jgi:hypothetical protein